MTPGPLIGKVSSMMNIFSQLQRKLGHFLLDHFLSQDIVLSWESPESPAPPWTTGPIQAFFPEHSRQDTDGINEKDLEKALKEHRESREIPGLRGGKRIDVPAGQLAPRKLAAWYFDRFNRIIEQDTVEISAINLQEELRKRLDGEV